MVRDQRLSCSSRSAYILASRHSCFTLWNQTDQINKDSSTSSTYFYTPHLFMATSFTLYTLFYFYFHSAYIYIKHQFYPIYITFTLNLLSRLPPLPCGASAHIQVMAFPIIFLQFYFVPQCSSFTYGAWTVHPSVCCPPTYYVVFLLAFFSEISS